MNKVIFLCLFFLSTSLIAQIKTSWRSLGTAEKLWVVLHPFSAKKAQRLTVLSIQATDSIQEVFGFPNPKSGGHKDALRHSYWMALLSYHVGSKRALWLGNAHEKKGEKDFDKKKSEEGSLADAVTMKMDLFNNEFGVKIGKYCYECSNDKLLQIAIESLYKGELRIIRQNIEGQSLDADGIVIERSQWEGKWENSRVLERSDKLL